MTPGRLWSQGERDARHGRAQLLRDPLHEVEQVERAVVEMLVTRAPRPASCSSADVYSLLEERSRSMKPGSAGANFRRLAIAAPLLVLAFAALILSGLLGLATYAQLESSQSWLRIGAAGAVWLLSLALALRALRIAWVRGAESTSLTVATVTLAIGVMAGANAGGEWALHQARSDAPGVASAAGPSDEGAVHQGRYDTLSVGSRDGRLDCFEALLLPEVQRDARKAAGREEWAQDVIHEAMVAVCTQLRPIRELVPYFIKTIANGAAKARRGAWAPRSCPLSAPSCPSPTPEEEYAKAEILAIIKAGTCALDEEDAELVGVRLEGARFAEVATRFGITEAAARQRFKRAIDDVRANVIRSCSGPE